MSIKKIWIIVVLLLLFASRTTTQGKERGFVALSEGSADYEHLGEAQRATSSFFLVNLSEKYGFALGALIYNSQQDVSENWNETVEDPASYNVRFDNIRHTAWGTLAAYSWSSETFLGLQAWGGVGLVSNILRFDGTTVSLFKYSDNAVEQCRIELEGGSKQTTSFPYFIGIGVTVWDFGVFVQFMSQKTDLVKLTITETENCSIVLAGDSYNHSGRESYEFEAKSSFNLVSTGIQYRF